MIVSPKNFSADALLIITGSMGSGKTTVLFEASDILASRNIPHAAIDLDALGTAHLPAGVQNKELMYRNLRSVWENYTQVGVKRLLLARAMENHEELECCREAAKAESVVYLPIDCQHTNNGGARSKPRGGRFAEQLRGSCCGTERYTRLRPSGGFYPEQRESECHGYRTRTAYSLRMALKGKALTRENIRVVINTSEVICEIVADRASVLNTLVVAD
jgi:hypothetical protein